MLEQTFVNDGMISLPLSLLHTIVKNCTSLWLDGVGDDASKNLSS
jgi:hypothetical protein